MKQLKLNLVELEKYQLNFQELILLMNQLTLDLFVIT